MAGPCGFAPRPSGVCADAASAARHAAAEVDPTGDRRRPPRRWFRHPALLGKWPGWQAAGVALAVTLGLATAAGTGLRDWAVGLGMDDERGSLVAALLCVGAATAAVTALSARPGWSRAGGLAGLVLVEIVPFLERAHRTPPTPGLRAHPDVAAWALQPAGMLLLGLLAAGLGAGFGLVIRADAHRLWGRVRRTPWLGAAVPLVVAVLVAAGGAAAAAIQDSPLSALYSYEVGGGPAVAGPGPDEGPGGPSPGPGSAAAEAPGRTAPSPTTSADRPSAPREPAPRSAPEAATPVAASGGAAPDPGGAAGPPEAASAAAPGHVETFAVDGRQVLAYLPGAYGVQRRRAFCVLYLLHGYPANPDAALSALQVPAVLNQLVGDHRLPPTIVVLPDGNGTVSSDAEWGDTANGNVVETWLTTRVVPTVDAHYRTLGPACRAIAGYSSGGYGAVNLALRHPDLFRAAASWSGYFEARPDIFAGATAANSPSRRAPTLGATQRMPLYIGAGERDAHFLDASRRFADELRSLNWPDTRFDVVAGGHSVEAWRAEMVDSLDWLGTLWHPQTCPPMPGRDRCQDVGRG